MYAIVQTGGKQYKAQVGDVISEVVEHGKGKKVIVFKYKPKKNIRKKNGHRQPFTKVEITAIA